MVEAFALGLGGDEGAAVGLRRDTQQQQQLCGRGLLVLHALLTLAEQMARGRSGVR